MIGISKLYCGTVEPSDALRYGRRAKVLPSHLLQFSRDKKPVVIWNVTPACNLTCKHCYAACLTAQADDQMSTTEAKAFIDDLAAFGSPVLLFSGGEPLLRPDLTELAAYAVEKGMRAVVSTNGTLLTPGKAAELKDIGLSYVGISIDGTEAHHNAFRGNPDAFAQALDGVRACHAAGIKVGLRHTITRDTYRDVDDLFDLLVEEQIPRICFYHLVYTGRGADLAAADLTHAETRNVVDRIIDRTAELHANALPKEVLTVDNHCDGPYLYLRLLNEDPERAAKVMELLRMNRGNSTGHGVGCVSWDGTVYPDQFWRTRPLGNVRQRPFSTIWTDLSNPLLAQLRDKPAHVTGKCRHCRFLNVCGGNFRARAEAATGQTWGVDPACYFSEEEIRDA